MSEKKLQNYPIAKKENESRRIKPNTKVKKIVSFILTLKEKYQTTLKKFKNCEKIFGKLLLKRKIILAKKKEK